MSHRVDPDGITISRLHGIASRHASRGMPEGPALEAAITELRDVATQTEKPRRHSPYPPREVFRADLLGEAAGAILGHMDSEAPRVSDANRATLLIQAGADPEVTERARLAAVERRENRPQTPTTGPPKGPQRADPWKSRAWTADPPDAGE